MHARNTKLILGAQSWGYSVASLDKLLLTLFDKYAQLLKQRFSEDFQEVGRSARLDGRIY